MKPRGWKLYPVRIDEDQGVMPAIPNRYFHIVIQPHCHPTTPAYNMYDGKCVFFSEGKKELFEGNCTSEPVGDLKKS